MECRKPCVDLHSPLPPPFPRIFTLNPQTLAAITQPFPGTLGGKLKQIPGCTGVLFPGMEALLFKDETGIPSANFSPPTSAVVCVSPSKLDGACSLNEPGELWLRSGNVALGYWNNPKANAGTFVHGWLRTGDRFRVDEAGYFWFADRVKVRFIYFTFLRVALFILIDSF